MQGWLVEGEHLVAGRVALLEPLEHRVDEPGTAADDRAPLRKRAEGAHLGALDGLRHPRYRVEHAVREVQDLHRASAAAVPRAVEVEVVLADEEDAPGAEDPPDLAEVGDEPRGGDVMEALVDGGEVHAGVGDPRADAGEPCLRVALGRRRADLVGRSVAVFFFDQPLHVVELDVLADGVEAPALEDRREVVVAALGVVADVTLPAEAERRAELEDELAIVAEGGVGEVAGVAAPPARLAESGEDRSGLPHQLDLLPVELLDSRNRPFQFCDGAASPTSLHRADLHSLNIGREEGLHGRLDVVDPVLAFGRVPDDDFEFARVLAL